MRMNRKDTQLLVENWRRLINEGEEVKTSQNDIKVLGSNLNQYLESSGKKEKSSIKNSPDNMTSYLTLMARYLRTNDDIEDYLNDEESVTPELKEKIKTVIQKAPEEIEKLQNLNRWNVAGQIAPMLQKK